MVGIPLAIFYYLYLACVVGFLLFTFFNVYHIIRFGFLTVGSISMIVCYLGGSIAIIAVSWFYINVIDWGQVIPFTIMGTFPQ